MVVEAVRAALHRVPRRSGVSVAAFRDEHLLVDRPVVLTDIAARWPAVTRWTFAYLREQLRDARADVRPLHDYGASGSRRIVETVEIPLADLVEQIERGTTGEMSYARQVALLACPELARDVRPLPYFASPGVAQGWLGPAGTITHMHWDPAENLLVQIRGRKRVVLVAPRDVAHLAPNQFSLRWLCEQLDGRPRLASALDAIAAARPSTRAQLRKLFAQQLDTRQRLFLFNVLAGMNSHDVEIRDPAIARRVERWEAILEPGDVLFMPFMWRHEVYALDPSVSLNWFYSPSERSRAEVRTTVLETLALHVAVQG